MARNVCTTAEIILELEGILSLLRIQMIIIIHLYLKRRQLGRRQQGRFTRPYSLVDKMPAQVKHLNRLVRVCDVDCFDNLRMDRNTFGKLCRLLKELGGMRDGRFVTVEEQVAMFLGILAHHKKSRIVRFDFMRSGYTVSKYVHAVLRALLDIYKKFLAKPDPVTDDSTDSRWKHFKVYFKNKTATLLPYPICNTFCLLIWRHSNFVFY